ncbi:hypothetical protein Scep_022593 [Stephania cephalantha]|uniref:Transmembrane protein n=1 Tax=Stephania cephalantha TaxID=152367 RepID=A0AAP0I2T9_9MAGN
MLSHLQSDFSLINRYVSQLITILYVSQLITILYVKILKKIVLSLQCQNHYKEVSQHPIKLLEMQTVWNWQRQEGEGNFSILDVGFIKQIGVQVSYSLHLLFHPLRQYHLQIAYTMGKVWGKENVHRPRKVCNQQLMGVPSHV